MKITFENIVIRDEKGYFFSYEVNGLYEMNMRDFSIQLLTCYQGKRKSEERLFSNLKLYKDWIILIPMQADEIFIYNIITKESRYLELPIRTSGYKDSAKFLEGFIIGNQMIVIGHGCPYILKLNLDTWKIHKLMDLFSNNISKSIEGLDMFRYGVKYKDFVYIPSASTSDIIIFNSINGDIDARKTCDRIKGYSSAFVLGDRLAFISMFQDALVICDKNFERYEYVPFYDDEMNSSSLLCYSNCYSYKNFEVIIPLWNKDIVLVDKNTSKIIKVDTTPVIGNRELMISPVRCGFVYKNSFYIISGYNGEIYILNTDEMQLIPTHIKVSTGQYVPGFLEYLAFNNENRDYNLDEYITDLVGVL